MMLARADWSVERFDDALIVCDALQAHAPAYASNGRLAFSVRANEHEAELRVLELSEEDAAGLVHDTMLPVVGNVLERIAERVSVEPDKQGESFQLVIVLSAN
jgi:serine/threonine-protein kinase RsbW